MSRRRAHHRPGKAGHNSLRIIGGQWRGRKLSFPDAQGLRPTGDRIRETLFNWLAPELPGAHCLDLFAGSGALGLEALSRGAASVTMIERDNAVATLLRQHLQTLNASDGRIEQADALEWLKRQQIRPETERPHFDIVFVDPPFAGNLWCDTLNTLESGGLLSDYAAIYVESPRQQPLSAPEHWSLHREKQAGQVAYRLYYRQPEP